MSRLRLLHDDAMLLHDNGAGTPETPDRLEAVVEALERAALRDIEWVAPRPVDDAVVARIHDPAYVERLVGLEGQRARLALDTAMAPHSKQAAWLAAGAGVDAVDAVLDDAAHHAFALVRPPGHHAEAAQGMGFCLLNNAAVAAQHARDRGCERVLVLDWDVHHGNGIQHLFEARDDVLYLSTHRHPFFPGTGAAHEVGVGRGAGYTVNIPMPWGQGDRAFAALFTELVAPITTAFAPDLIVVSAGFDAHRDDPLGDQRVSEDGFAWMAGALQRLARATRAGGLVLLLEGGYDLGGLANSARAVAEVLAGAEPPPDPGPPDAEARSIVAGVREIQAPYWPALRGDDPE